MISSKDLFEQLKREKKFSASIINGFNSIFGKKFYRALEFIQKEGPNVRKNIFKPSKLIVWTVQGSEHSYIVYPDVYCQCHAFLLNSIYRKREFSLCKHLLAQKLAKILNVFEKESYKDTDYISWIKNL